MSSGFVSGGTNDAPTERDAEWLQAQKDLEISRREKEEAATQEDGKSLYEILQANKAAKQSQYEESLRLKNQFRALDDDEIDFLDSVLESTRENERKIKQETVELLDDFRKQRAEADQKAVLDDPLAATGDGEVHEAAMSWGKKRKRKEKDTKAVKGAKVRRSPTTEDVASKVANSAESSSVGAGSNDRITRTVDEQPEPHAVAPKPDAVAPVARAAAANTTLQSMTLPQRASAISATTAVQQQQQQSPPSKPSLGLVSYGSSDSE